MSISSHFELISDRIGELSRTKTVRVSTISLIGIYVLRKILRMSKLKKDRVILLNKANEALLDREDSIKWAKEQIIGISNDDRKRISIMNFEQLKDALQKNEFTCELVVRVYLSLALKSHDKTNCLTLVIKDCIERARILDEAAKSSDYKKPPLFGIPVSIKESVSMKGFRNSWGCANQLNVIPNEDHYIVERLKECGMIPFVMTNIPTSCLTYNCDNGVWGQTTNPYNRDRTPGGSSGGEGALIGSNGSLIGIGSDLGGSSRIPASYCGCVGFRPTATRFTTFNYEEPIPCRPFLMPTEGPLGESPQAIAHILRSLWSDNYMHKKIAYCVPVPFQENLYESGKKYKIGYFLSDSYIESLPGVKRVISEAVKLLESKGHTLVPFTLDDIPANIMDCVNKSAMMDGGAAVHKKLREDLIPPSLIPLVSATGWSSFKKKCAGYFFKFMGDTKMAQYLLSFPGSTTEVQEGIDKLYSYRKEVIEKINKASIDVILCPATVSPALSHNLPNELPISVVLATMFWNAMDFPAGVVPMGFWNEKDEKDLESYEAKGYMETMIKQTCKGSIGLPLAVQFVAPPYRDELALRIMSDLFDATKK